MNNKYFYTTFLDFLKKNYGFKLAKIGLSFNIKCNNNPRCSFCNGTSFIPESIKNKTIIDQFLDSKEYLSKKYKTDKFIAYFQDETSTNISPELFTNRLKPLFTIPEIKVLSFSTRPDSITHKHLDILKSLKRNYQDIWIELGLQSVHNSTLTKINRNHSYEDFLETYNLIKRYNFKIGIHLIVGLPDESNLKIIESFKKVNQLKPDFIKIHHLQIVKDSYLASQKPLVKTFTLEEYIKILAKCLCYINSNITIARLVSSSHPKELIKPKFNQTVPQIINKLKTYMLHNNLQQGIFCKEQ